MLQVLYIKRENYAYIRHGGADFLFSELVIIYLSVKIAMDEVKRIRKFRDRSIFRSTA